MHSAQLPFGKVGNSASLNQMGSFHDIFYVNTPKTPIFGWFQGHLLLVSVSYNYKKAKAFSYAVKYEMYQNQQLSTSDSNYAQRKL